MPTCVNSSSHLPSFMEGKPIFYTELYALSGLLASLCSHWICQHNGVCPITTLVHGELLLHVEPHHTYNWRSDHSVDLYHCLTLHCNISNVLTSLVSTSFWPSFFLGDWTVSDTRKTLKKKQLLTRFFIFRPEVRLSTGIVSFPLIVGIFNQKLYCWLHISFHE